VPANGMSLVANIGIVMFVTPPGYNAISTTA